MQFISKAMVANLIWNVCNINLYVYLALETKTTNEIRNLITFSTHLLFFYPDLSIGRLVWFHSSNPIMNFEAHRPFFFCWIMNIFFDGIFNCIVQGSFELHRKLCLHTLAHANTPVNQPDSAYSLNCFISRCI